MKWVEGVCRIAELEIAGAKEQICGRKIRLQLERGASVSNGVKISPRLKLCDTQIQEQASVSGEGSNKPVIDWDSLVEFAVCYEFVRPLRLLGRVHRLSK